MGDVPSLLKHKCIIWMDKNVTYIIICSHSCLCKIVWLLPVEHKRGISEEYPDRTALNHIIWGRQAPKWQKAQPFTATSCHFETWWHQFSFTFIILATLLRILLRNSPLFHRRKKVVQVWNDMRVRKWWQKIHFDSLKLFVNIHFVILLH